jgi:hypothetical protein
MNDCPAATACFAAFLFCFVSEIEPLPERLPGASEQPLRADDRGAPIAKQQSSDRRMIDGKCGGARKVRALPARWGFLAQRNCAVTLAQRRSAAAVRN